MLTEAERLAKRRQTTGGGVRTEAHWSRCPGRSEANWAQHWKRQGGREKLRPEALAGSGPPVGDGLPRPQKGSYRREKLAFPFKTCPGTKENKTKKLRLSMWHFDAVFTLTGEEGAINMTQNQTEPQRAQSGESMVLS